ncbi:ATP-dependent DNA helicase [bacterium]|nr:ATP-dependent DNA helicase [bacterium]|tara:strand:+ start:843 stop:2864 length:2022 start_codon:yes stop_codon:yes gene_type:complete
MSHLDQLNSAQKEAVMATEGPLLVIAGAGSGKTRVIEHRVAHLVENGVSPEKILLLTFTRRAAGEMLRRAAGHVKAAEHVEGGTFHSFAYKMLRKYGTRVGVPKKFSILDEGDAEEAIHRCATQLGFYDKKERFPKKGALRKVVSQAFNKQLTVEAVLLREYPNFLHLADEVERLRDRYAEYKMEKGYLDYDDLLFFLLMLLQQKETQVFIAEKYSHVMVDEYQDTNRAQGEITYFLGRENRNVMVVGDDAQSIYGFRGASHENIMEFPKRFSKTKVIKLEENYRSTQDILDVANAVLDNMASKYSKEMRSAHGEKGVCPTMLFFGNSRREAEWIAGKIKELRDEGESFHHQAVLFRSTYASISLQAELARRNIPFQLFGGVKFYETAHAKDLISHLKILVNLQDELAWNRVLMLLEGIGPRTASQITDDIISVQDFSDVFEILDRHASVGRYGDGLKRLLSLLREVTHEKIPPLEQLKQVSKYYEPIFRTKFDDWPKRLNDILVLQEIVEQYKNLDQFLADFVIDPPRLGVMAEAEDHDEKPLTLSTIHSAKGLEWDYVFVIGLMEGVLPSGFALGRDDEIEEEHRLFYVGVTRAKKQLFLSASYLSSRGRFDSAHREEMGSGEISRFLTAPNVISKVEHQMFVEEDGGDDEGEVDYDDEGIGPVRRKEELW